MIMSLTFYATFRSRWLAAAVLHFLVDGLDCFLYRSPYLLDLVVFGCFERGKRRRVSQAVQLVNRPHARARTRRLESGEARSGEFGVFRVYDPFQSVANVAHDFTWVAEACTIEDQRDSGPQLALANNVPEREVWISDFVQVFILVPARIVLVREWRDCG